MKPPSGGSLSERPTGLVSERRAQEASIRRGAITIMLLDGAAIADLMVEWGIGVVRQPLYVYEVDPSFFEFNDD